MLHVQEKLSYEQLGGAIIVCPGYVGMMEHDSSVCLGYLQDGEKSLLSLLRGWNLPVPLGLL